MSAHCSDLLKIKQIIGSFFGATITFLVTWWMFTSIENICHPELLPPGSPWTCPYITMMSSITAMYGLVGPSRVFFPHGVYSSIFIFFIIGAVAPIPLWLLARAYPEKEWISKVKLNILPFP
jgi:glycerol uptake facilitator-like aquaporin